MREVIGKSIKFVSCILQILQTKIELRSFQGDTSVVVLFVLCLGV